MMPNAQRLDDPSPTIVDRLYETAERYAERIAVRGEEGTLTYAELHRRSNRLAGQLAAAGAGRDAVVAICLPRSLDLLIAIFGTLKAGAAYLPLRPDDPMERSQLVLQDSAARYLVSSPRVAQTLSFDGATFSLEDKGTSLSDDELRLPRPAACDLAYVIYTSGSTGRPKGVAIEHGSLENRLRWMQTAYPITQEDVLLQKTVYTFDVSVWELLWWALQGASVVLLPNGQERDPRAQARIITKHGVSAVHFVPSMLTLFLEYLAISGDHSVGQRLRWVFASGEKLMADTVSTFQKIFSRTSQARLINLYGPTEATVDVTHHACAPDVKYEDVPIGQPIHQTRCYVLDEALNAVPDGERGDLYLAGIGLARGYYNNPALTAQCFFEHPRVRGERLYKTGDLVYRHPVTGDIHYIGRADSQIKLRGLRIELGEIDYHLRSCAGVSDALVFADATPALGQYIAALISSDAVLNADAIWSRLAAALPNYMLPARLVIVDDLPRLPNGKIDRVAAKHIATNAQGHTCDLRTSLAQAR